MIHFLHVSMFIDMLVYETTLAKFCAVDLYIPLRQKFYLISRYFVIKFYCFMFFVKFVNE